MDNSLSSIFSSKPFDFVVEGHEDKPFFIHSAVVARVSKPLERHINSEMREVKDGRVSLKEVELETVARFCDWAYTGSYNAQDFSERSSQPLMPVDVDDLENEETLSPPSKRDLIPRSMKRSTAAFGGWSEESSKKEALKSDFLELQYGTPDRKHSHARLYVFAEKFDIQPLKRLVLRNLHQTLANFTVWPDCVGDVVELLTFVYGNTLPAHNGEEPMRTMLSQYVGFTMDKMLEAATFRDLLKQNQDFLNDFCAQVMKRI